MRTLASIQKIKSLTPIDGADAIELAQVQGWKVVVKKGEFTGGGLVVYCEIDSVLPERPEFEFLRQSKFRIRTIRLRGQVSQGICFPISVLPQGEYNEGDDVTELLGVVKYEPPIPAQLTGVMKGNFPSFIPKTDETRVQNLEGLLYRLQGTECYVTEKLDGSSATFYMKDGEFGVCSRNIDLQESKDNSFWRAARELRVEERLRELNLDNIALQGELIGPAIQGNKLKLAKPTVFFFNVFDISRARYYDFKEFVDTISLLGFVTAPILTDSYILPSSVDEIVSFSEIRSVIEPSVWAEGIVIRPLVEQVDLLKSSYALQNGRVSFKAINPKFLLKYDE